MTAFRKDVNFRKRHVLPIRAGARTLRATGWWFLYGELASLMTFEKKVDAPFLGGWGVM